MTTPHMSAGDGRVLRMYYLITFISFGVFLPYLPAWLEGRGVTGLAFGVIAALRPVLAMFSPVLFGIVADRFGLRGSLIRTACIVSGLAMAALALLPRLTDSNSFIPIFFFMALFSFFRAPMVSIADVTALEGEKSKYGSVRRFGSLGFLVSALLAGYLLDPEDPIQFPAFIALAMFTAAAVSFALPGRVVHPPKPAPGQMRQLLREGGFHRFLLTTFLWLASHAAYDICLSLHLRDLGAGGGVIGWAWAVATLAEIVLMGFSERIFRAFSAPRLIAFSMGVMAVRWVLMATVTEVTLLLLLQPLHAASFALFWIAALEYVRNRAPEGLLATAQGLYSATAALGGGMSMLMWGPLYGSFGGAGVFFAAAGVALAGLLVSLSLNKHPFIERSAGESV